MNTHSKHWKQGYRAAVLLKSRQSCPYNGPELRADWLAGYDTRDGIAAQRHPLQFSTQKINGKDPRYEP